MDPEEVEKREKMKLARKSKKNGKKQNHNVKETNAVTEDAENKQDFEKVESCPETATELLCKEVSNHKHVQEKSKENTEINKTFQRRPTEEKQNKNSNSTNHQPPNQHSIDNLLRTIPPLKTISSQLPFYDSLMSPQTLLNYQGNLTMTDIMRHAYVMTSLWRNSGFIPLLTVPGTTNPYDKHWMLQQFQTQKEKYFWPNEGNSSKAPANPAIFRW